MRPSTGKGSEGIEVMARKAIKKEFDSDAELEMYLREQVDWQAMAKRPASQTARQRKTPPLRRSLPTSIRLTGAQIEGLKHLAEERATNYQTLLKQWIAERLERELASDRLLHQSGKEVDLMVVLEALKAKLHESIDRFGPQVLENP